MFKKNILGTIFSPKRNNQGDYEIRNNKIVEDLSLYKERSIVGIFKKYENKLDWACIEIRRINRTYLDIHGNQTQSDPNDDLRKAG